MSHHQKVYAAERLAMDGIERRTLARDTVHGLCLKVVGRPVRLWTTPADDETCLGLAFWQDGTPHLAFPDLDAIDDVLLAHELGHLLADRDGMTGHGAQWITAYLYVLRQFHRDDARLAIREEVGPVAISQPVEALQVV